MRFRFGPTLPAWLFMLSPAWAEDISVRGTVHPVVVSNLRRMQDTMDAIALRDGQPSGLHLHVAARLEPGDRPPEDTRLFLDTKRGPVSQNRQ
ncbi:hypothetical protein GCM10023158_02610 [Gluconacetobacter tumulicola]